MQDYYGILGISNTASRKDIKKAFREKAKRLHPDIAGAAGAEAMRKLLCAYEVLSSEERRSEYDRAYGRFVQGSCFDYRRYLAEDPGDPERQAKLVFFDLLHLEEDSALAVWRGNGGLGFAMNKYLGREDWLDCSFILAEELARRGAYYEAFMLLADIIREERRRPYFRHYTVEIENALRALIRFHLKAAVDGETFVECMEMVLELGFPPKDEARWMRSLSEALLRLGELKDAEAVFREALRRDPALPNVKRLGRKLNAGCP
jgi:curved DNA-binding protein CbpA